MCAGVHIYLCVPCELCAQSLSPVYECTCVCTRELCVRAQVSVCACGHLCMSGTTQGLKGFQAASIILYTEWFGDLRKFRRTPEQPAQRTQKRWTRQEWRQWSRVPHSSHQHRTGANSCSLTTQTSFCVGPGRSGVPGSQTDGEAERVGTPTKESQGQEGGRREGARRRREAWGEQSRVGSSPDAAVAARLWARNINPVTSFPVTEK